jgi:NAD(P)-dependent dehydrogenase (short-subunit alcohol dehydrogenase family)
VIVKGDFLEPAEIERSMKEAVSGLGGSVDILVNNVGDLIQRVPVRRLRHHDVGQRHRAQPVERIPRRARGAAVVLRPARASSTSRR